MAWIEKISPPRNGADHRRAGLVEGLADLPNCLGQRIFRDIYVRPDRVHQFSFRDDPASTFGEVEQKLECLSAKVDGCPVLQQQTTVEVERKFVETKYRARVRPHRRLTSD